MECQFVTTNGHSFRCTVCGRVLRQKTRQDPGKLHFRCGVKPQEKPAAKRRPRDPCRERRVAYLKPLPRLEDRWGDQFTGKDWAVDLRGVVAPEGCPTDIDKYYILDRVARNRWVFPFVCKGLPCECPLDELVLRVEGDQAEVTITVDPGWHKRPAPFLKFRGSIAGADTGGRAGTEGAPLAAVPVNGKPAAGSCVLYLTSG